MQLLSVGKTCSDSVFASASCAKTSRSPNEAQEKRKLFKIRYQREVFLETEDLHKNEPCSEMRQSENTTQYIKVMCVENI